MGLLKGLVFALALGSEALATKNPVTCSTKFGSSSLHYIQSRTSTKTNTVTTTKKILQTKVSTITPPELTKTITTTVSTTVPVTVNGNTDTVTATHTNDHTVTITATETTSTTETEPNFVTTTRTIPADGDFIFITDPTAVPRVKRMKELMMRGGNGNKGLVYHPKYPQRVDCVKCIVKTVTVTATSIVKGPITTLPAKIKWATTTVTQTSTLTTQAPDVSVTLTVQAENTVSTTITTTVTKTYTVKAIPETTVEASAPYYDACGPRNQLTQTSDNRLPYAFVPNGWDYAQAGIVPDAYSCCVACFQSSGACVGSAFITRTKRCVLMQTNICQATNIVFKAGITQLDTSTLSNGRCGTYTDGGDR